jgi:plasmid maintenance system antidote protein VapI
MDAAFDTSKNMALRLEASIDLARAFDVPEEQIIHDLDELDAFMLA